MQNVFSIDVEDWFHILDSEKVPSYNEWGSQKSIVAKRFMDLLDLLDERGVKSTCFFLGWVAARYPMLVKEAKSRGHEVASHGYRHKLVFLQSPEEFKTDISEARKLLEDISGSRVIGYRSPGFSIKNDTAWALDAIRGAGYLYDSSLFPAKRGHGGWITKELGPHPIDTREGRLMEFPITVDSFVWFNICYFGGGYLRFFPYSVIKNRTKKVQSDGRPVVFYIHPRDICIEQPRLDMGFYRNFKSYINLTSTKKKLRSILGDFEFTTFSALMEDILKNDKRR